METIKIDDNTIQVTKQIAETKVVNYDVNFLTEQRATIVANALDYATKRQTEIDEIDALLAECGKLGVVAKLAKPII